MKIVNVHVGNRPKCENCKLIWKLQTDMKIANWYENYKAILTFRCIVPPWMFAIFIWDTVGMKTCSGTERMFWFDCGVDDKNSTKHSFAKPSTIHISIPIPMLTKSDSYFKPWFLCSQTRVSMKTAELWLLLSQLLRRDSNGVCYGTDFISPNSIFDYWYSCVSRNNSVRMHMYEFI